MLNRRVTTTPLKSEVPVFSELKTVLWELRPQTRLPNEPHPVPPPTSRCWPAGDLARLWLDTGAAPLLTVVRNCEMVNLRKLKEWPVAAPDDGNVPGNPLRSYRMSMLSHGFVDQPDSTEFMLDESDPMSYSVVRIRGGHVGAVWLSGAIFLVVVVVMTVVFLG